MKRALWVLVVAALLGAATGCGRLRRRPVATGVPTATTATSVVVPASTPELAAPPSPTPTPTLTPIEEGVEAPTATLAPLPTVTPGGPPPIPDSVLDFGINREPEFTWREAKLAVRVFNGDSNLGSCVVAARTYMKGFFKEPLPTWGEPMTATVPLSSSWSINGVSLSTTSGRAFKLEVDGEVGWLYEVTAPAGTFISQLACRRDGSLYAYNAPIERDGGVAYLFVWRSGLSRAFFMGGCANFGVVEEHLPTPTPVPPTKTASPTPSEEVPTKTPGPTATPTSTSPPPTETPAPTLTPTSPPATSTPKPTATPVPPTSTPVPPTPTPKPTSTVRPTMTPQPTPPEATYTPAPTQTRVPTATRIPPTATKIPPPPPTATAPSNPTPRPTATP